MAFNAHRLGKVHHVMRRSLLATLANKHRTRIATMARRLATKVTDRGRTLKALILIKDRGQGKKPLVAMFGGISLAWKRDVIIDDSPKQVYNGLRSELVRRLLAQKCELCGTEEGPFEVHHIRKLAELDRPSRREKPLWVKRMASRRRKALVTCQRCHQALHRGRAGWRKKTKHWKAG